MESLMYVSGFLVFSSSSLETHSTQVSPQLDLTRQVSGLKISNVMGKQVRFPLSLIRQKLKIGRSQGYLSQNCWLIKER